MFQPIRLFIFAVSLLMGISMISFAQGVALTDAESGGSKPGSILIYNLFMSRAGDVNYDTGINITNTHATQGVSVRMFFVDGSDGSVMDRFLCLPPSQTKRMLASEADPDVRGYILAVAVNDKTGHPVNFNHLIGSAHIVKQGFYGKLAAESVAALSTRSATDNAVTLHFNGTDYQRLPSELAQDSFSPGPDVNGTLIVLNRIGGDASGMVPLSELNGMVYDDLASGYSFSARGGFWGTRGSCQYSEGVSDETIPITPALSTVLPLGRIGWMRWWTTEHEAMTGASLILDLRSGGRRIFMGSTNMTHLRMAKDATFQFKAYPPSC
jgi:hypothetical protein